MNADEELGIAHLTDVEMIGHGGFSWVYAATDTQLQRRVAVKLLNEIKTETDRRRFDRECEILGKLSSHPHIVTVFAAGYTDYNRPYLIMELVSGGSIDDLIARQGSVGWHDAVEVTQSAAGALQAAHSQGVLHRDIKPENVLLEGREPRLADFGIAMLRDSAGATSTKITASWLHAPPETFENRRDERSDLYSLASTLYTMIAGTAPFWRPGEDSLNPLVLRLMSDEVAPLDPALAPPTLNRLIMSALAKDPDQRPQSAAEFAAGLQAIRSSTMPPGALTGRAPATILPEPGEPELTATQPATPNPTGSTSFPVPTYSPAGAPDVAASGTLPTAAFSGHNAASTSRSNLVMFVVGLLGVLVVGGIVAIGALMFGGGDDGEQEAATGNSAGSNLDSTVGDGSTASGSADPSIDPLVGNDPAAPVTADTMTPTTAPTTTPTTAPTVATAAAVSQATLLTGTWQGTYVCSQGMTGMTLAMVAEQDGSIRALLDFYAIPENPGVPSGTFTMNGQYTPERLELIADRWIRQPTAFVTADLSAELGGARDDLINGDIVSPTGGCSVFALEKIDDALVEIPD